MLLRHLPLRAAEAALKALVVAADVELSVAEADSGALAVGLMRQTARALELASRYPRLSLLLGTSPQRRPIRTMHGIRQLLRIQAIPLRMDGRMPQ